MRRRKPVYPPAKTATKGATPGADRRGAPSDRVVVIDVKAMHGRSDVAIGSRVEIASGRYAGEVAVVESVVGGVIPAVVVRIAGGQTRRVRAVDIVPLPGRSEAGGAGAS